MSSLVLGVHVGHHSACALVRDGQLVAAAQLERSSRIKHHPVLSLSNDLNLATVLDQVGATIADVDLIVSSFQATAPAGFGLDRALIEQDFSLFDPWSRKHVVLSHHLAHSHCGFDASGFDQAAVLVCDYAGSGTVDGEDFALPFEDWYARLCSHERAFVVSTECLSIYRADRDAPHQALYRDYNIAHPGQPSFVYSIAGLYENVAQYAVGKNNAHGQLMALAAYGQRVDKGAYDPGPLVEIDTDDRVHFRNDWQHAVPRTPTFEQRARLAFRCQEATELALLAHARRAKVLTGCDELVGSGGVFLNILANTRLSQDSPFRRVYIPSAPHDAGVAIGCAFYGARRLGERTTRVRTDRLGPEPRELDIEAAFQKYGPFVRRRSFTDEDVLSAFARGQIVARLNGRAEFGPRALGGRSLLASPLANDVKDRMNRIKGRQEWRPVAPIIARTRIADFFDGPADSPWMTKSQRIRPEHVERLPALVHPDGSTRAQTLSEEQDPELHRWLLELERQTGYPILVNTSFNRGGEPIVEGPMEALDMFLCRPDIDVLLLGPWLVERDDPFPELGPKAVRLGENVFLTTAFHHNEPHYNVTNGRRTWRVTDLMFQALTELGTHPMTVNEFVHQTQKDDRSLPQTYEFLLHAILITV